MIEDLIKKINDEQKAEESEIEDCKNDIQDNTKKRAKNGARMEEEEAAIVEAGAAINDHDEEAKSLGVDISELYKSLNEATELRAKEAGENKQTLEDANAGNDSISKAIQVLKEFYDSDFEAASLVQTRRPADPEMPDSSSFDDNGDTSKQDEAKGILGLLGTIKEDYESTIEKTTQEEKDLEKEFGSFSKSSQKDISSKKKMKANNEKKSRQAATDREQAKEDLLQWTKQKGEAEYELSILTPRCLGLGASAEERKKRRQEEKRSLKEAITILDTMGPAEAPEASEEFLQIRK